MLISSGCSCWGHRFSRQNGRWQVDQVGSVEGEGTGQGGK